jgi:hypothetical protein
MPSPNSGMITSIGPLGVDLTGAAGFDIAPRTDVAYGAFRVGTTTSLYTVNLTSGMATAVGAIGGNPVVRAIAVLP